jgi:hypothetical protein
MYGYPHRARETKGDGDDRSGAAAIARGLTLPDRVATLLSFRSNMLTVSNITLLSDHFFNKRRYKIDGSLIGDDTFANSRPTNQFEAGEPLNCMGSLAHSMVMTAASQFPPRIPAPSVFTVKTKSSTRPRKQAFFHV